MFIRRHFSAIALTLALLLAWSQQLVAAHGVVHPFQDGGAQTHKHAHGSDSRLCDLCVISALDNVPVTIPDFGLATEATHVLVAEAVASQTQFTPSHYHSRGPPVLA
ncbi:hypothetical protein CAP31_13185 [Sulfuriferula sp. AH1]|uniref:hypothetical protein n=1 Tax=Sulfuriferula sp. AH1 TaxID=1985873 RepID=UPI000B3B2417|nr:hypothetical protein [Sulfuriferula sp. AH1]ARU32552.1 hypothetical protein CAP31_13185 [Sulfuriferula sp. AH1]